jgi:hypothetical protein
MRGWASPTISDGSFWVSIYGDNGGLPGAMLPSGGLTGPATPQGAGYHWYTVPGGLMLAFDTRARAFLFRDFHNGPGLPDQPT